MLRLLKNRRLQLAALFIGALLAVALWPDTVPVDVATAAQGPIVVTVDDEGQTRVHDRFVVSAPVAGRVLRIELEPGDAIRRGDIVARVQPEMPALLDPRARAEAEAAVHGARAALGRARAEEQRAKTALASAARELARTKELRAGGLATAQELELRETEAAAAREAVRAAEFAVTAANADLRRAEARLRPPPSEAPARAIEVPAPVDGVVLRRLRESESVVPAGEPLLELGDPAQIEVVADFLSTDAVRVRAGARAMIDQWGGGHVLDAKVRRVEPSGFTKISALGVEEQRVNIILDFVDPAGAWRALGDGYRVEVRIVIAEKAGALKVPTSALFREGERWAVYVVEDGRARRVLVKLGLQTGLEAEIVEGLSVGDRVVLHPGESMADGVRVEERHAS